MVPCINAKPYLYSELLMTVNDLMDEFFPSVSMTKCREVLQNVLHINLYSGNLNDPILPMTCEIFAFDNQPISRLAIVANLVKCVQTSPDLRNPLACDVFTKMRADLRADDLTGLNFDIALTVPIIYTKGN
ncbi:unnamed protein product, partial [Nesidiocoris tenuis]